MESLVPIYQLKAIQKGLSLTLEIDPDFPSFLLGDMNRIRQIIGNLLDNAIKFTNQGGVSIMVDSLSHESGISNCVVAVKDSGIGISESKIKHLFKPFIQADASISRHFGGTGLGLAISYELAQLMGGKLTVKSKEGEGSTFTLYMPLSLPSEYQIQSESFDNLPATKLDKNLANIYPARLLIVEDNPVNQLVAEKVLEKLGYQSVIANNGYEALEVIKDQIFDLIFMDIFMPGLDGNETTKKIMEVPTLHSSPPIIIAITANAFLEDKQTCLDAGMVDFLPKPFKVIEIEHLIKKWIKPVQKRIKR